ncbi:MAG TPA: STAS domain-containing protein [Gaiellales bacterium]|jgi:anti-anti-sigma factor
MSPDGAGRVTVDRTGPTLWIVELTGEHDLSTVARIQDELTAIFEQGTTLVVDLSAVTFMDSSVLRELIVAHRRAEANDDERLVLVAPAAGFAARLMEMVNVRDTFSPYETRAEALRALEPQA